MHQAIIAQVESTIPIPDADRIHLAVVLGEYCVVSKDVGVGYIGVLFPADLQLSEEYAYENNLHREASKNKDQTKKGFFENNRKVRAQPFLGVRSTAYFASLDSLNYTGRVAWAVGERFNELSGHDVCKRYVSEKAMKQIAAQNGKARKQAEVPLFMKHTDTDQFNHYAGMIPEGAILSFHAKKHGTSFRVGKLAVVKQLPKWKELVNRVVNIFSASQYELVVGSRNVLLKNPEKEGFHGSESFRFEVAKALEPHLTDGMQVYGEIVGYVNGRPVMPPHSIKALKDQSYVDKYGESVIYSYGCADHEYKYFVYRITVEDVAGNIHEFDQQKLEAWCQQRGIAHTLEIFPQVVYDGDVGKLKTLVERLTERHEVLTEDYEDPRHISEGIIVREDYKGRTKFYKSKSIAFKICEGILTVDDMETVA